jgi:hypothetical protein
MINSDLTPSASHDPGDLVGTWKLVSVLTEQDGRKFDAYGPNAKGLLVFDANGRYSIILVASQVSGRVIVPAAPQRRLWR